MWDTAVKASIGKPLRHHERVYSTAFSPNGARAVTASDDKTARVWGCPAARANLIATACKILCNKHHTDGLSDRYAIEITDPICGPDHAGPRPLADD
jgi:WD40 repeat protein